VPKLLATITIAAPFLVVSALALMHGLDERRFAETAHLSEPAVITLSVLVFAGFMLRSVRRMQRTDVPWRLKRFWDGFSGTGFWGSPANEFTSAIRSTSNRAPWSCASPPASPSSSISPPGICLRSLSARHLSGNATA
jgi:hypothetical protein